MRKRRAGADAARLRKLKKEVWGYWRVHGRHDLPWRNTTDPYRILVSEVMLQQTQVPRVTRKYRSFIKRFATVRALAKADLASVLREWSGLGYNRRGKYLHDAARKIMRDYDGDLQGALAHPLPGVGPYTRAAVCAFAFNEPAALIETNIRTVFTHYFFSGKRRVSDREILALAEQAAKGQDPRTWHWALMDYGANLKAEGVRLNHKSAHYRKQSAFEGSLRQVRGAILRALHKTPPTLQALPFEAPKVQVALLALERDGLIKKNRGRWRIA